MASSYDLLEHNAEQHVKAFERFSRNDEVKRAVVLAADKICAAYETGGKLLLCGNGGSAADCQHIAAEFVGRFKLERRALPAIVLSCNTSSVTAIGNDYDYERVFSRQAEAFARPNDVLLGVTTSGSSRNVLRAIETAKTHGCTTILLTSETCKNEEADITIKVPSDDTPRIQEMHIFIGHFLAQYVELKLNEDRESNA